MAETDMQKNLRKLRDLGVNPYPYNFKVKQHSKEIKKNFKKLNGKRVSVAGRLISRRGHGKISFANIQDQEGDIQIVVMLDQVGPGPMEQYRLYDRGDIIGVTGQVFKTRAGEISIKVKKLELLSKAVKQLPSSWYGLKDVEIRYRQRYVDLIMNDAAREVFVTRAKILESMREFMKKNDFLEVETPLLQAVYGGAFATPFKTYIESLKEDLYLAIAPELPLKKALVGGFERVYEITKKFRNEGVDKTHNPEHLTIEWYQGYADYNDGMKMFEGIIKAAAKSVFGKLTFEYQGKKIDLRKWTTMPLLKAIKKYLKEDISGVKTDAEARKVAKKHGIDPKIVTAGNLADELMKLFRHKLIQPTFLTDYPIELAPLAKPKRGDPTKAEIFQPFIGGMELGRAYSELNDPVLQENNFLEQENERQRGNVEAMPADYDFITALQYGMPPACGVGIGIERVVMLFTNQTTIRDVILFPMLKSKIDAREKGTTLGHDDPASKPKKKAKKPAKKGKKGSKKRK